MNEEVTVAERGDWHGPTSARAVLVSLLVAVLLATPVLGQGPGCCGDLNDDGRVGVAELVSLVKVVLGQDEVAFSSVGNCGELNRVGGRVSVAVLQRSVVSALRGCGRCVFPLNDMPMECTFRAQLWFTTGEVEVGWARLTNGLVAMNPDDVSDGFSHHIFFGGLIVEGVLDRKYITRTGFDGFLQVVPWYRDTGTTAVGEVALADGGRRLALEFTEPQWQMERLEGFFDEECQWSVQIGGCL